MLTERRVEDDQFADAGDAVVARDHADDARRMAGDRSRPVDGVRPVGIAVIGRHLVGAVRVHGEEQAGEVVRRVGVFPSRVHHRAVVEHRRVPVVVLIETKPSLVLAVVVDEVKVADIPLARAGHGLFARGGHEHDLAVGQAAGVIVFGVVVLVRGDLAMAAAIDIHLVNPQVVAEEDLPCVEAEIHIADVSALVDRRDLSIRFHRRQRDNLVADIVGPAPVGCKPRTTLAQEQLVERQHRIG